MRRVAVDFSSFAWRALTAGADHESGKKVSHEGKVVTVNSAEHGYENITNMLVALLKQLDLQPIDTILVFEGMSSKSRRLYIDKSYKANRESRPPEAYEQFTLLSQRIASVWRGLGATAMTQDHAEGDDTLAWLAQEYPHELTVATYDGDLTALNTEDGETNAYGGTCQVWIDGTLGINKFGGFPYKRVRIYKALVGDPSDGIKGVAGFGPTTFFNLVELIGWDGIDELEGLLESGDLSALASLVDDTKTGKIIAKIVASADSVRSAWQLVKLRPEWVNTMVKPLQIVAGKVSLPPAHVDSRLAHWYCDNYLITAAEYENAVETVRVLGAQSPFIAFDIETSTSDESDDWLAACNDPDGVDTLGSVLTGFSLTFGRNMQTTVYVSVDHADTANVTMVQARKLLEVVWGLGKDVVVHNAAFELPVIYLAQDEDGTRWSELWQRNGYRGFIPKLLDSKISASYCNENIRLGLKLRSLEHLGYKQESYESVTVLKGLVGQLPRGGKLIRTWPGEVIDAGGGASDKEAVVELWQERKYKMRELTAVQVFSYGADDTICTASLQNYFNLINNLEHTVKAIEEVEVGASYANALAFVGGIGFSMTRMLECEAEDKAAVDAAWPLLRSYLIEQRWDGTACPIYGTDMTPAQVKEAFEITEGKPLGTTMRTLSKLVVFCEAAGAVIFSGLLQRLLDGDATDFNAYVKSKFSGEPVFNSDSPVQMKRLMYETLKLPVRLTNKVTDIQRSKGITVGTPKTDDLAMQTAIYFDNEAVDLTALKAIQIIKQCGTRSKLFYEPYKSFPHWSTGRLHPSTNQCATVTRRNSASKPNYTQWPAKNEGLKFRETIVARGPGRVIISSDSSGQELRLAADLSRDDNMLSCYLGENKRDIHSMVAASATKYFWDRQWSYEEFYTALKGADEALAETSDVLRGKAKAINFGEIYGMQAKSASERLMIPEAEAEAFIKAKKAQFPGVDEWKADVVKFAKLHGYSKTLLGARRHLRDVLINGDKWEISKAERQLANAEIQASGAEAIKIALGKCFVSEVMQRCDVYILGSIHDEIVLDVPAEHAWEVGTELVTFMQAPYGGMIVPFVSETTIGVDFGKQLKLPLGFTREDVDAQLLKLNLRKN
jgi:DNA polymerase I-like protein with 3'-5' exonuclease and polymerase domains/5'-3' exonuclease